MLRRPKEVAGAAWKAHLESRLCWKQVRPLSIFLSTLKGVDADLDGRVRTARELTIEAAQSAGSSRALRTNGSARSMSAAQIKKFLDSRNDRDILDGLRKVISVRIICSHPCFT